MFNFVMSKINHFAKNAHLSSVARSAGWANPCAPIPGLTPRALCCRVLRALFSF